jgi:hypothetical protein
VTAIVTTIVTAAVMTGLIALAFHSKEVLQYLTTASLQLAENFKNAKVAVMNKF